MFPALTSLTLYEGLARLASRGFVARQLSYMGAGWMALIGIRPPLPSSDSIRLSDILTASVVLIGGLILFSSTVLSMAQPLLVAVGGLTLERAVVGTLIVFFVWRYLAGRKLVRAFLASQGGSNGVAGRA